jgi:archaellin
MKRTKVSRNDRRAEMGVGQTLILISTILIAAMGAGVLLQTGGGLFSRGDRVAGEVEDVSSSKIIMAVSYTHLTLPTTPYV